jgi:hypothetical protein
LKSARTKLAAIATVPLTLTLALSANPSGAVEQPHHKAQQKAHGQSRPAAQAVIRLGHRGAPSLVGSVRPSHSASMKRRSTFRVTYRGFTPKARIAVNIWAPLLNSRVPITVNARFAPLGQNVLGSAGPGFVWHDFARAPRPKTWYVDAVANKHAGHQLSRQPDINAQFSSNFRAWWFGAGRAPAGRVDFTSVVLHELGHGLGFVGAGRVGGGRGTVRIGTPRLPLAFDRYTEGQLGSRLIGFPDPSAKLAKALTNKHVYFDSPQVRAANGGKRAKVYAPRPFQPGSSYSHLSEGFYGPGNRNSLMTPVLNYAETIRTPGPITRAIFANVGW